MRYRSQSVKMVTRNKYVVDHGLVWGCEEKFREMGFVVNTLRAITPASIPPKSDVCNVLLTILPTQVVRAVTEVLQ